VTPSVLIEVLVRMFLLNCSHLTPNVRSFELNSLGVSRSRRVTFQETFNLKTINVGSAFVARLRNRWLHSPIHHCCTSNVRPCLNAKKYYVSESLWLWMKIFTRRIAGRCHSTGGG